MSSHVCYLCTRSVQSPTLRGLADEVTLFPDASAVRPTGPTFGLQPPACSARSLPVNAPRWFWGELLGTFILVFVGCSTVATAVALGAPMGLVQVALVWGLGLSVAIFLTGGMSGAHLNPAITIAMAVWRDFPMKRVPGYIATQMLAAFLAAGLLYLLYNGSIVAFESASGVTRGEPGSEASAMIFGEFFPNPDGKPLTPADDLRVSHLNACLAEAVGTALLALAIFGFTGKRNESGPGPLTPLAIGITLTVLISLFAPLSQAGFNPARDFAPRVFSALAGWGGIPFSTNGIGWLTVYIVSPIVGALAGGWIGRKLFD